VVGAVLERSRKEKEVGKRGARKKADEGLQGEKERTSDVKKKKEDARQGSKEGPRQSASTKEGV